MFSFRTTNLLEQDDLVLKSGRLGIFCNHTSWHPEYGEYLFETLARERDLRAVFTPEHGLFGELQDQVRTDGTSWSAKNAQGKDIVFRSLYGTDDSSLSISSEDFGLIDALIIEIQDAGARYYTYTRTMYNIFRSMKEMDINMPVYVIDRMNPAGRQVEGTPLRKEYESFIGIEGLPHRHGLTAGELANMFHSEMNARFPLHIISYMSPGMNRELMPWSIPPSPNFPGLFTAHLYSGQCLWEGTNISEGRGTARPFEFFGAPFMKGLLEEKAGMGASNWNSPDSPLYDEGVYMRWTGFMPQFGKYAGEMCYGFQILLKPDIPYHALAHNLRIIRFMKENLPDFRFIEEQYERGNDRPAIELLAGVPDWTLLLSAVFIRGTISEIIFRETWA